MERIETTVEKETVFQMKNTIEKLDKLINTGFLSVAEKNILSKMMDNTQKILREVELGEAKIESRIVTN